jgi:hypothetical protein
MVKTETTCPSCGGRITMVRDLADELGAAEVEAYHAPGCPALHPHHDARSLASQAALWDHERERAE